MARVASSMNTRSPCALVCAMRVPLSRSRKRARAESQFCFFLAALADASAALASAFFASSWRLRKASSGVRAFFASLPSLAASFEAAEAGCEAGPGGAFSGVDFTPGGGLSPYWTLPSLSTQRKFCACATAASDSRQNDRTMRMGSWPASTSSPSRTSTSRTTPASAGWITRLRLRGTSRPSALATISS